MYWNQTHLHAELYRHADAIPDPVKDFYTGTEDYPFKEKLLLLDQRLSAYIPHQPVRYYFKYLFQGICQYYLEKPSYATHLQRAAETRLFPEFLPRIFLPDPEQKRNERILVIVSFDNTLNNHFKHLCSIHDAITVIAAEDDFDPEAMLKSWGAYDQVFIAGHGEDKTETYEGHIRLGNKLLKPGTIAEVIDATKVYPTVLGIFTCGEAFYAMEAKRHIDFFIADHQSSVSRFIEMFLYGYLMTYFKTYNVLQAFQAGRLATIFMAKSDPTYKIFTRGVKLQE